MLVVTRAGRLREWSQGELRLYLLLIANLLNINKLGYIQTLNTLTTVPLLRKRCISVHSSPNTDHGISALWRFAGVSEEMQRN